MRATTEPPASRVEDVRDTLHGVEVVDPYRWLEDSGAEEVRAWTAEQNAATRAALARPVREQIRGRLDELLRVGLLEVPRVAAGAAFLLRRNPDEDQPVLYVRERGADTERPLVDPTALAGDRLVTIDWYFPSPDGRFVAFGLSRGGDELSTLYVVEVATGRLLHDDIPDTRFASVAWLPDASGFYYTRYPAQGSVPQGEEHYNVRVRFHELGGDPADDPVVFGEGRTRTDLYELSLSPDGRLLLIAVHRGSTKMVLYLLDRASGRIRSTGEERDAIFRGEFADGRLYVLTNWQAPNWRVLEVDPETLDVDAARTVVPEREDGVLAELALVGRRLVLHELVDASSRIRVYSLPDGGLERELELRDIGSVAGTPSGRTPGIAGEWEGDDLLFGFTSFLHPPAILRCELGSGATSTFAQLEPPPGFDPTAYKTLQGYCRSADGTSVPLFLVHRRGLQRDASAPAYLTGYGGFNIGMSPSWISSLPLWVEAGGIYAVAALRGGNEFGERWHRDGMLDRKQNVFDDFAAAADWLVDQGYTSRERLAIGGGSNGGLLVGAALTQRPDLCRAVVCEVPLLDMIRYHNLQIAQLWTAEYGSPDDRDQFRWLHAYSPYHRVVDGARYPAVLLTTALGDTRVDPMHARKMAARLQAASESGLPVLLRVDADAGHGIGKPRSMQLDSLTDAWTFVCWQLGVEL